VAIAEFDVTVTYFAEIAVPETGERNGVPLRFC
jgi:hypothetical protein